MNNKLLSFAIPTYNRAKVLEGLLNNIFPKIRDFKNEIEICISNNGSTDNTKEVVFSFKNKYPELDIKYRENEKNLGFDANILEVVKMCSGDFVWTFSDDDYVVSNGFAEVINFLKSNREDFLKNVGLIVLRVNSYLKDKKTGEKFNFVNTFEKEKPEVLPIDRKDIIALSFPNIAFISILIYNNKMLQGLLAEDLNFIEKGIGTSHLPMVLFSFMFLKYPFAKGIVFNKEIVCQELSQYNYYVEDKFTLHYKMQRHLNETILAYKHIDQASVFLIKKRYKGLALDVVADMMVMKAFGTFKYFSYFGCLKLFFKHAVFFDFLLFSLVFTFLFLIPSSFLIFAYKIFLALKHGKAWKQKWNITSRVAYSIIKGDRRRNEQPH